MKSRFSARTSPGQRVGTVPAGVPGVASVSPQERHQQLVAQGNASVSSGQIEAARAAYSAVLGEDDQNSDALMGMGLVAHRMGQLKIAEEFLRRAIAINSKAPAYWSNLGNVLLDDARTQEAVEAHSKAVKLGPKDPAAHQNLGNILNMLDRPQEALKHFRLALKFAPNAPDVLVNLATCLTRIGDYRDSLTYFEKALRQQPAHSYARYYYGSALNWLGRWQEGWEPFDGRIDLPSFRPWLRYAPYSEGLPEELSGKSVLVAEEQGIGDQLRFATMIPDLVATGAHVTLECHSKLLELFRDAFNGVTVVPYSGLSKEEAMAFDLRVPMGSLGKRFRSSSSTFAGKRALLTPRQDRVQALKARLAEKGEGPKIGLCWRSGVSGPLRNPYYAGIEELEPLLNVKGLQFVCLQYDECGQELRLAREKFGVEIDLVEGVDLFNDLPASVDLMAALDFVVSANTSVASLAGAAGVAGIEFHGRPVPKDYLIEGADPWFPSLEPMGKRFIEAWRPLMRQIAGRVEKRLKA